MDYFTTFAMTRGSARDEEGVIPAPAAGLDPESCF